jgi:hypothetical protein
MPASLRRSPGAGLTKWTSSMPTGGGVPASLFYQQHRAPCCQALLHRACPSWFHCAPISDAVIEHEASLSIPPSATCASWNAEVETRNLFIHYVSQCHKRVPHALLPGGSSVARLSSSAQHLAAAGTLTVTTFRARCTLVLTPNPGARHGGARDHGHLLERGRAGTNYPGGGNTVDRGAALVALPSNAGARPDVVSIRDRQQQGGSTGRVMPWSLALAATPTGHHCLG